MAITGKWHGQHFKKYQCFYAQITIQVFKATAKNPGPKVRSLDHLLHRQRKAAKKFRKKFAKNQNNDEAKNNFEEKFRQIKEHIAISSNAYNPKHIGQNSNNDAENDPIINEFVHEDSRNSLPGQNTTNRKFKPPILDIGEYQQFILPSATELATTATSTEPATTANSTRGAATATSTDPETPQ